MLVQHVKFSVKTWKLQNDWYTAVRGVWCCYHIVGCGCCSVTAVVCSVAAHYVAHAPLLLLSARLRTYIDMTDGDTGPWFMEIER